MKNRKTMLFEVAFSESHYQLNRILKDTSWHASYRYVLARFDGAKRKTCVFADNKRQMAISIPYHCIFGPEDKPEEDFCYYEF